MSLTPPVFFRMPINAQSRLHAFVCIVACLIIASVSSGAYANGGYRVSGSEITHEGETIRVKGINWFGFETVTHSAHGLWARNWREIVSDIARAGFNAVRIPICPATLSNMQPGAIDYALNPELKQLNSLDILDKLVSELDRRRIHVLIDHHRPDCQAISELWHTDGYSEAQWLADLVAVARRYRKHRHFMGLDLKNEPHGRATWGTGDPETDWKLAAEKAAAAILAAAPEVLIFVEGIQKSGDCAPDIPESWWGGNLTPLACYPLDIPREKLVLSPHVYGPDVYLQPDFEAPDFPDNMESVWDAHFGRFADQDYAMVIGEFGGRYGHNGDPRDIALQNRLVEYMRRKHLAGSFYWALNPNSEDLRGLFKDDWRTFWPSKLALLKHLWHGSGLPSGNRDKADRPIWTRRNTAPPVLYSRRINNKLSYHSELLSTTPEQYCVDVRVSNETDEALDWQFKMPLLGRPVRFWNVVAAPVPGGFRVKGQRWNRRLLPGQPRHFGYCAGRETATTPETR